MRRMWLMACAVSGIGSLALGAGEQIIEVNLRNADQLISVMEHGDTMACRHTLGWQQFIVDEDGLAAINAMGLETRVVIEDLDAWLEAERDARQNQIIDNGGSFHQTYHRYNEIETFIDSLVALDPSIVTKTVIGSTIEGRDMHALRIASSAPGTKPAVAVTAMQHAREWASGASALWMAEQLVEGYGSDPEITALVDNVEWHIIPVCNPDGYEWSHTDFRLWRLNRRINQDLSIGVDLNRNWGYEWAGGPPGSSSSIPGNITYRGPSAFSEPENRNVRDYLQSISMLRGHIDLHTFSQLILGPWGYEDTITPPREDELRLVQEDMETTITSTNGVAYQAGLGVDQLLYTADGVMPDWVFGQLGALSWTYELRDTGTFGFELPANQIIPTATEAFEGIKRLAFWAQQGGTLSIDSPISIASDSQGTPVDAKVTPLHNNTITAATLYYRFDTGAFSTAPMTDQGDGTYRGIVPPGLCGATVEYYTEASFSDGSTKVFPEGAPGDTLTAPVAPITTLLADNFQTDTGWTTQINGATSGGWERGVPVNDPSWEYDPAADGDGSGACYLTQNAPGNTDVDAGSVTLISPALDLSPGGASIEYHYYLLLTDQSGIDGLRLEVSANGTAGPWTEVAAHTTSSSLWRTGTITQAMLDSAGITPTIDTRVRFIANDDNPQSIVEAGVDGVVVRLADQCPAPNCPGDVDGDLMVDVDDLNEVLGAWQSTPAPGTGADLSGDGVVDVDDLNIVLGAWGDAC